MVINIVCDSTLLEPGSFLKHLNIYYHETILHVDVKYQISPEISDKRQAPDSTAAGGSVLPLSNIY